MAKAEFATKILTDVRASIDPDPTKWPATIANDIRVRIASSIKEYLDQNTTITCSYNGTTPGGSPDVIQEASFQVGSVCSLAHGADFLSWYTIILQSLEASLLVSPQDDLITTVCQPWVFTTPNLSNDDVRTAYLNVFQAKEDVAMAVWETICQGIITWCQSALNPSTSPATRPGSTGTIIINSVVVH